jgi:hypothetical protein
MTGFTEINFTNLQDSTITIEYNFPTKTIYSSDVTKASLLVNFSNKQPNIAIKNNGSITNYTSSTITFYEATHKIAGVTAPTAEMVITLNSLTNNDKCYLCFLLVNEGNDDNDIDNLLATVNGANPSAEINVNTYMKSDACYYANVIVMRQPIRINNAASLSLVSASGRVPFGDVTTPMRVSSSNMSPLNSGEIYIDCQPSGASASEIASYNVPINSEYTQQAGKLKYMDMFMNFSVFFVILLVLSLAVPAMYKYAVIQQIMKWYSEDTSENKYKTKLSVDFWLPVMMIFYVFIFVVFGSYLPAFVIFIFTVLSMSIIQNMSLPDSFGKDPTESEDFGAKIKRLFDDFFGYSNILYFKNNNSVVKGLRVANLITAVITFLLIVAASVTSVKIRERIVNIGFPLCFSVFTATYLSPSCFFS